MSNSFIDELAFLLQDRDTQARLYGLIDPQRLNDMVLDKSDKN